MKRIDVHTHLGNWMFPIRDFEVAGFRRTMQQHRIEKSVISYGPAILYDFREGNRQLAAILQDAPELWGYVVLNPHYLEESLAEIEKYLPDPKFVGFKLHPEQNQYRLNGLNVYKLFERITLTKKPVLVHTFPEQTNDLLGVAKFFPSVPIIMGHMGGNRWWEGIAVAAQTENVYLEPCSSFPEADKVRAAVEAVGPGRVLFGSDSNLLNPGFTIGMIEEANLADGIKEQIFYQNAKLLFNFPA